MKLLMTECMDRFGTPVANDPDLGVVIFWNESLTFNVCYEHDHGMYENVDCFSSSKKVDFKGAQRLAKTHIVALINAD